MRAMSDTTVTDLEYDLVTTLSNLLQGREVLSKYAQDAEAAGDMGCAEIFRTLQTTNEDAAGRIRNALARILNA
jgi:uncharacterized Ntn-hydrolase superfamily protein